MHIEKQLTAVSDQRFIEAAHQVIKRTQALLNTGCDPLARLDVERSTDWLTLQEYSGGPAEDEAKYWLTELLEQI